MITIAWYNVVAIIVICKFLDGQHFFANKTRQLIENVL